MAECIFCAIVAQQLPSTVIAEMRRRWPSWIFIQPMMVMCWCCPNPIARICLICLPRLGATSCACVSRWQKPSRRVCSQMDSISCRPAEQPLDRKCFIRTFICCHGGRGTTRSAGGDAPWRCRPHPAGGGAGSSSAVKHKTRQKGEHMRRSPLYAVYQEPERSLPR